MSREALRELARDLDAEARDVFPHGPPLAPAERDPAIREAVERALADGTWSRYDGPRRRELESALAARFGHSHARTSCSGTFAVELALRALRLEPGDEVLLAGYDYPGNFRAIEAVGAAPVLVDVEPESFRLAVDRLKEAAGDCTRAVIVSHLHGQLSDLPAMRTWADERGITLIEDFCQAVGATIGGRPVGGFGHLSVLSFGGSKTLTAGRGGAVLVSDETMAQRMTIFAERGNDAYPLAEMQAAAILPQLNSLDALNRTRRIAVERLVASLTSLPTPSDDTSPLRLPPADPEYEAAHYKWGLLLAESRASLREETLACFDAARFPAGEGFRGFVRRAARRCRAIGELRESARAADASIVIHHSALTAGEDATEFYVRTLTRISRALADATPDR